MTISCQHRNSIKMAYKPSNLGQRFAIRIVIRRMTFKSYSSFSTDTTRAVFDGGLGGFDPSQEVADPQKSSAEPLWGVDSNPLNPPDSIFLLNQYIYLQLYATYAYRDPRDLI